MIMEPLFELNKTMSWRQLDTKWIQSLFLLLGLAVHLAESLAVPTVVPSEVALCPSSCSCNHDVINCSYADFETVPNLGVFAARTLVLDNNEISYLVADSFGPSNVTNWLEGLAIRHNNLSVIDPEAFQSVTALRFLHLDANQISSLPSSLFESNTRLESLSLANNQIGTSDSDWNFLRHLGSSLKDLDVSSTAVTSSQHIPPVFSNLSVLEKLTIQYTKSNITNRFFDALKDLDILTLDLSNSVINYVDEEAFLPLQSLRNLIITYVKLDSASCGNIFLSLSNSSIEKINMRGIFTHDGYLIESDLFRHLENAKVRELNFVGNFMGLRGRVPTKLFHPLKSLRKLHLDDCDLVSVHRDTFHGLHEIKVLTMRRNLLSCVKSSNCSFLGPVHPMRHIETLDLSDNLISEAENAVHFNGKSFPALRKLILHKNRLRSIQGGMFGELKMLNRLDLSENPIESIESESFIHLESLTHLNLDGCRQLTHIRQDTFKGLIQVVSISIRNGGLINIHHAALLHLSHLEELQLRNNRLGQSNDAIAKVNIRKSSLKFLDLGENDLTSFPKGLISNSFHLRRLHLDSNRLSDCRSLIQSPDALLHLEELDLSYNILVEPSKTCFDSFDNLKTIDLSANPFYCSCQMRQLATWLQQSRWSLAVDTDYICAAPDQMVGRSIFKLNLSNYDCYWKYGVILGLLVCLLLASAVVMLVLCFRQKRSQRNVTCSRLSTDKASNVIEAVGSSCAMFGKTTPYAPLDEEESASKGGVDGQELSTNGTCWSGRTNQSGSVRDSVGRTSMPPPPPRHSTTCKKPSKCNGFNRTKTRQPTGSNEPTDTQTRALVRENQEDDDDHCIHSSHAEFRRSVSDADHIESLEDTV